MVLDPIWIKTSQLMAFSGWLEWLRYQGVGYSEYSFGPLCCFYYFKWGMLSASPATLGRLYLLRITQPI